MFEASHLILTACPSLETAKEIAQALVEQKLAACVKLLPQAQSTFWWEGQVKEEIEIQLLILTRGMLYDKVAQCIQDLHPYEVPEIIALAIHQGSPEFLDWIKQTCG